MPPDIDHAPRRSEAAAWVLGALDPGDALSFEDHLQSCQQCRAVVAQFEPVAEALRFPYCAAPPADLEARTVASVQYAVMAASRPQSAGIKASRWWHRH